jgi:Cu(I)/Ag(I) efflux system membrane protein CusA/SilA
LERLNSIPIAMKGGGFVPLGQVATIARIQGPNEIASENGRLRVFVQANVQDRDRGGFVGEIKRRIEQEVTLPAGMTVEYAGQYENQIRARETLQVIMPVVLLIIFAVLYLTFHSAAEAAHVILAVPFALTGGVLLQYFLGFNFSVAVWVGYIALFGTAIQTGVVMVVYLNEAVERKRRELGRELKRPEFIDAVKAGARLRLRPKVMTVATAVAGLMPIFWSSRTGVEVMQPLAAPVVGGMLSSLIHILVVTPVIFAMLHERKLARA